MACISPYMARVGERWIPTPCGRCPPCKKRRVDSWVFRLLQEDKVSSSAHFVTLTYNTDHVPISPNGFMTLTKGHEVIKCDPSHHDSKRLCRWPRKDYYLKDLCCFTKYIKRLRKLCPKATIKYYGCGEYGSTNHRPHWHAIIFNVPDDSFFYDAWHLDGKPLGDVHVGNCTGDSVAYCMKYIDKRTSRFHSRDDRISEFSLMSKGLGASYVSKAIVDYHNADLSRQYLTVDGGYRIAMPRYYRQRVFDEDARAALGSIIERAIGMSISDNYEAYLKYRGDNLDYSYSDFVQSQRDAQVSSFYDNQKSRK